MIILLPIFNYVVENSIMDEHVGFYFQVFEETNITLISDEMNLRGH